MKPRATVVGARGFLGGVVASKARAEGFDVLECRHDDLPEGEDLGSVIYCSGVAWDADKHPIEAYEAHVAGVARVVATGRAGRIVYISSTRVYDRSTGTAEDGVTGVAAGRLEDTYALSKLAGEGLTLAASEQNRVLRCSNIYGESFRSGLFLGDILRQAAKTDRIELRSSRDSSKDYVSAEDVAEMALRVAGGSRHRIYNVAAGRNTSHGDLLDAIEGAHPIEISIPAGAPAVVVPEIDVRRVRDEYAFAPRNVLDDLPRLVHAFRTAFAR